MNRICLFLCFLCIPWAARGQSAYEWRYWFDDAKSQQQTGQSATASFSFDADVSALAEGPHAIYVQIADNEGRFSPPQTRLFYHLKEREVNTLSYWFDNDQQSRHNIEVPEGPVWLDVSALSEGFHTVYFQVGGQKLSEVTGRWFVKIPQANGPAGMTCICTIDEKMVEQQHVPATGGIVNWNFDVSSLPVGLHRAVFQVVTASGAASAIAERFFVRAVTSAEMGQMKCVYTLDRSSIQSQAAKMANGLFHFDLDVSQLEDGLHHIAYMMVAADGTTRPQQTAFFWKTPISGNAIVQYDYWLNDKEQEKKSVRLDSRTNPFRLISMLPVDPQPVRSQCFHFEVADGQPTVYAKNDIHFRFYDTTGRCVSDTRQFVDYQLAYPLADVEMLKPGVTATADRPGENGIKWYRLTAFQGDSLTFKADAACSLQLFSPSGDEVYTATGSEATEWGGLYAAESGTYYLALHDVAEPQATTVSIDYALISRGDVNLDGNIDVADIATIISVMAGNMTVPFAQADVNGDGKVDVADIAKVISMMAARARAAAALFD